MSLTLQEIFDISSTHLLTQNEKSMGEGDHCLYYHPNGLQCAVGCLIPPSLYYPALEGGTVWRLEANKEIATYLGIYPQLKVIDPSFRLLQDLQHIHDGFSVFEWPQKLEKLRVEHGLNKTSAITAQAA